MLIDKLDKLNYNFGGLPNNLKQSIDLLTSLRKSSGGQANQKLSVLDLEIFKTIEVFDPNNDIIIEIRNEYDFDRKLDSNNSFNSTGLIELNQKQRSKLEAVDNLVDLSDQSESNIMKSGGSVDSNESYFVGINAKYKNPFAVNRAIEEYLDNNSLEKTWSEDERKFIGQYSGYGGLEKQGEFTDDELKRLLYEYYTPDEIVKKMWGLAYKYGFGSKKDQSVLEPSVGIGAFLKYAPLDGIVDGIDINKYSVKISTILFPKADIKQRSFEQYFISRNSSIKNKIMDLPKYSLVIGNPPYGKLQSKYIGMGEDKYTKATNWVEYFITRGLDLLHSGGLLIYIIGAEQKNGGSMFLDSDITPAKKDIFDKAMLIDAYRLPTNLFERTGVSSEIVVFKKH